MDTRKILYRHKEKFTPNNVLWSNLNWLRGVWASSIILRSDGILPTSLNTGHLPRWHLRLVLNGVELAKTKDRRQTEGEEIMEMKRYEFIVTLENGQTVKTVESGRTPSEAQAIVESQHGNAKNVAYRGEV